MEGAASINPWLTIWREPIRTIKTIVSKNPRFCFPLLAAIYGLPISLHFLQSLAAGENFPLLGNLVLALILCIPFGYIGIYITAAVISWVGRLFSDTRTDLYSLQAVVAWSNLPTVITIIVWAFLMIVLKNTIFTPYYAEKIAAINGLTLLDWRLLFVSYLIRFGAFIWSFVLLVQMNAKVQNLSTSRSIANILIAAAIISIIGLLAYAALNNLLVVFFKI